MSEGTVEAGGQEPVMDQGADAAASSETVDLGSANNAEPKMFDADYVKSLRQEAAKYRTQAKEMGEKAAKYDEYVESQKSEQQKMQEALATLEKERDELRSNLMRQEVAARKQLPPSLVARLQGSTPEELEADADSLLTELRGQFVERSKPSPEETGAGVVGEADGQTVDDFLKVLASRRNR